MARSYLDMDAGRCFVPELNGEAHLLEVLATQPIRVVFDVGANVGDWTDLALATFGDARIHSFELIPDTARLLQERFAGDERVTVNATGLDAEAAEITVHYYPSFSEGSGLHDAHVGVGSETRDAKVVTGDDYCREHGIDSIDFLKLDVEGNEGRVLQGFEGMLARGSIRVIQFEYGVPNIVSRVFLADLYERLEQRGYLVGKVYPRRVDFSAYDRRVHEDFRGPNYVAVAAGETALIDRLAERRTPATP